MGIYDREYYRDENSSFLGGLASRGRVVNTLIAVNVVCLFVEIGTQAAPGTIHGWFTDLFQLRPSDVLSGQVWRLLTCAFLHSLGWQHIVFNMLTLWWAGTEVEDIYGPREFLGFYLFAAILSSVAFVISQLVIGSDVPAIGASGAVMATLVLFAMHYPKRTIYIMWVIPVPAIVVVALYALQDAFGLMGGIAQPVAFAAHLGGAAFGFLYYRYQWRVMNMIPDFARFRMPKRQPRLRVFREEPEEAPVRKPTKAADEQLEAELDAVLAKVTTYGKSSLTERELTILMRASEVYRNRRK